MAPRPGISGVALLGVAAGGWLIYSGVRDVAPIGGLRDLLQGTEPEGRARAIRAVAGGRMAPGGGTGLAPSGRIVRVPGTGIRVDASIAPNVERLIRDARADGIRLDGSGYRSELRQAQLRVTNGCPDIYESPSSACDTPTARPGESEHQKGLAIDFTQGGQTLRKVNTGWIWLVDNAHRYGLRNLPGEPWHWSTTGR